MTSVITALAEISGRYDAVYCDLWGCLHNGRAPFPEAVAALGAYRAAGGTVVLLTNAPRPAPGVVAALDRLGVPRAVYDLVVTSGDATQGALVAGLAGARVWHLGPAKDDTLFTDPAPEYAGGTMPERVELAEADAIVCTGPFDDLTETPAEYRARFLMARTRGLPMFCANPDLVVDYGTQRIHCAGSLAALYEEMGGETFYFGKPHPPVYDLAQRRLATHLGRDIPADRILAIGDGPATDIAGAQGEGIDALFVTDGLAAGSFGPDRDHPDPALLKPWLATRGLAPRHAIGRLR